MLVLEQLDNDGRMDSELLSEWMLKASNGDWEAQRIVTLAMERQLPALIRFVERQLSVELTDQERMDLQQEFLVSVAKAKFNYDVGQAKFSTWAIVILRRKVLAHERQKIRRRTTVESDLVSDPENPLLSRIADPGSSRRYEEVEAALAPAREAMKLLPPREAYIIDQHTLEERTYQDLATELGLSKERVRQLHEQALARLRVLIEENSRAKPDLHEVAAVEEPARSSEPEPEPSILSVADPRLNPPLERGMRERILDAVIAHLYNFTNPMTPEQFENVVGMKPENAWSETFSSYSDFKTSLAAEIAKRKEAAAKTPPHAYQRREIENLEKLDVVEGTKLLGSSTRAEDWTFGLPKARGEMAKRIVDYIMENGERPATKEEIARIAGFSYEKVVGLGAYAEGQDNRHYALFEDPAAFKAAWDRARENAIETLERKEARIGLTEMEKTRLKNLFSNPPLDTRDGLFQRKPRLVVTRAANWESERPVAQKTSAENIVAFLVENGRLPNDEQEIKAITGFGYEKLIGDAKYHFSQPDSRLAVFPNKDAFKQSWTALRTSEIERLKAKESDRGLTSSEKRQLKNLELAVPTTLPDGIKSRVPPFVRDAEARKERLKEQRKEVRQKIVAFIAAGGRVPTQHDKLAKLVDIGEDRLFSKGKWAEGKPRHEYGLFKDFDQFNKEWMTEAGLEVDRLNLKKRTEGLTAEEEQGLVNLRKIRP